MASFSSRLPPNAFPRYPSHLRDRDFSKAAVEIYGDDGRFDCSDSDDDSSDGSTSLEEQLGLPSTPLWYEQGEEGFKPVREQVTAAAAAAAVVASSNGAKGPEVMAAFEREVKMKGDAMGKQAIVLQSEEMGAFSDDDEEEIDPYTRMTIKELRAKVHVAYLNDTTVKQLEKWRNELEMVGMDDDEEGMFSIRNTASSYEMYRIIAKAIAVTERHLKKESFSDAFDALLGITISAHCDDHWWHDTDDTETPSALTKHLAKLWQRVLSQSNNDLGGLGDETRTAVKKKLASIRKEWETEGPEFGQPLKFKWNKVTPTLVAEEEV